jgi:hypothetical protein
MAIQTRDIKPVKGEFNIGAQQTEKNRRSSHWYKSDLISVGGDTSNTLFRLPNNCIVVGGFVSVETAFDASGTSTAATATVTVTNSTGTETIYDAANTGLQSTGLHPATGFAIVSDTGGAPVALFLYDPGTTTGGAARVYLEVVHLDDLL